MKKFTVQQHVTIAAGQVLDLTAAQAADRSHIVRAVEGKKGRYTLSAATQFKSGERIGIDPGDDRTLVEALTSNEDAPAA